ncbi:MAG: hypothetical protein ACT4NV_09675 [Rhodoferax sp.]
MRLTTIPAMHIHQMQASYQTDQDRILLRLNTFEGEELRIWLTRRMLKALLPHLQQLASGLGLNDSDPTTPDEAQAASEADADTGAPHPPEAADPGHTTASPTQDSAAEPPTAQGDFETAFDEHSVRLPLGEEPLLTTALHVASGPRGGLSVRFDEHFDGQSQAHRSVEAHLEPELLGGLVQLLGAVLRNADWGMSLPSQLGEAQAHGSPVNPRTLDAYAHHGRPKYLN